MPQAGTVKYSFSFGIAGVPKHPKSFAEGAQRSCFGYRFVSITETNGVAPPVAKLETSAPIAFHSGVDATALNASRLSNHISVRM